MKLWWVGCCLLVCVLTGCQAFVRGDTYIVKKSDTLYSISRKFDVPMQQIISRNNLRPPYRLSVNQKLFIPSVKTHTVRKGDTIYSIAKKYKVSFKALGAYNGIGAPWTLKVGQKLRIPTQSGQTMVADLSTPSSTSTSSSAQTSRVAAAKKKQPALTAPKRTGKFTWPASGKVVSHFGASGNGQKNDGINIAAAKGTPVKAADNGVVAYAGNEIKGFGNLLLLKHENNWVTAYAHNDSLLVKRGDVVKQGQTIAKVGSTGNVNKPQLHFEIRKNSKAVDPLSYMK